MIHPEYVLREPSELPYGGEHHGPDGFRNVTGIGGRLYEFEVLSREDFPMGDRMAVRMRAGFTGRAYRSALP
jgi:hypothetical protein